MKICLSLIIILTACAPLPGPNLFQGLTRPTPLENVGVMIVVDSEYTTIKCNKLIWENGNKGMVVANALLNLGFIANCSSVHWDTAGNVTDCEVYLSWDLEWARDHELRHCMGYADNLY